MKTNWKTGAALAAENMTDAIKFIAQTVDLAIILNLKTNLNLLTNLKTELNLEENQKIIFKERGY